MIDFLALKALVVDLNFDVLGVAATVTVPHTSAPIDATVIWVTPVMEDVPSAIEIQRREPRRILALKRSDVPAVPRGTVIVVPERSGGEPVTWLVDGLDRQEAEHTRVIVVRDDRSS